MTWVNIFTMISALGIVIALIVLLSHGLKYLQAKVQPKGGLDILSSVSLDTKRRACVLKVGAREFLLILGHQNEHVIELSSRDNESLQKTDNKSNLTMGEVMSFAKKAP